MGVKYGSGGVGFQRRKETSYAQFPPSSATRAGQTSEILQLREMKRRQTKKREGRYSFLGGGSRPQKNAKAAIGGFIIQIERGRD